MDGYFFRHLGLDAELIEAVPLSNEEIDRIEENLYRATVVYHDPVEGDTDAEDDFKRLIDSLRAARRELAAGGLPATLAGVLEGALDLVREYEADQG